MELLFPYNSQRAHQEDLVKAALDVCTRKKHLLVHAPTGLGKTAAALAPALTVALEEDLTVFFLTARHTQHLLALQTLHDIEKKAGKRIPVLDLIGKKWLCLQPGADRMHSGEFIEFCRALREDQRCDYYENLKGRDGEPSQKALLAVSDIADSDGSTKSIMASGKKNHVCPYEVALLHGRAAKLVIADYGYVFNDGIREPFLAKIGKDLSKVILVVDEAHNLPERVKDLASSKLSTFIVRRAKQEAAKHGLDFDETLDQLDRFLNAREERYVQREDLEVDADIIDEMEDAGDAIREDNRSSYIGSVASFLKEWNLEREGFARILGPDRDGAALTHRCLDPGVITGPVYGTVAASITMSGTLTPTQMYAEVLDLPVAMKEMTLPSPFRDENRLILIVPKTTTKYTGRSPAMYEEIGRYVTDMVNAVPGNSIVFFPSYDIMNSVKQHVLGRTNKPVFEEAPGLSKELRETLLATFKAQAETGAVLLAVTAGSFAEGVDLPGDLLKAVVIVGVPLAKPTKEVEALIAYYDKKFGRGWDYGYTIPAFNKVLQSAGRPIRTMTDRGAIIFLDERFAHPQYLRLLPPEWKPKTTLLYKKAIADFFAGAPAPKASLVQEFSEDETALRDE